MNLKAVLVLILCFGSILASAVPMQMATDCWDKPLLAGPQSTPSALEVRWTSINVRWLPDCWVSFWMVRVLPSQRNDAQNDARSSQRRQKVSSFKSFFFPKRKNSNAAKEAFLLMLKPNRRLQIYFTSKQKSVKPLHRTTGPRFQPWVFKYPPPTHNNLDCVKSIKSKTKNIQQWVFAGGHPPNY